MSFQFHLFEPLTLEQSGGRKARQVRKAGEPIRWIYSVREDAASEFFWRLRDAGYVFFLLHPCDNVSMK